MQAVAVAINSINAIGTAFMPRKERRGDGQINQPTSSARKGKHIAVGLERQANAQKMTEDD